MTAPGTGSASSKASGTLRLVVEINRFGDAHQDTDPPGDSPGDESFSEDPVFDAQNRKRVGHKLTLNSFPGGHRVLFTGALALRDGTITLGGVFVNGKPDIAVTGGTRAYAGASGTYHEGTKPIVPIVEDQPGRYTLNIVFAP